MCIYTCPVVLLTLHLMATGAYKITREANPPIPALKNAALEYKGPVFLIKETDNANESFIGLIVDGGIEMVRPNPRPISVPYGNINLPINESIPEVQEDPEYFAVLVTPDTVSQAQISRTTTITIPLPVLLTGVSAKMPWLMVLKKRNHFDYFKSLMSIPIPINMPQRRRYKRSNPMEHGRLFSGEKNYALIYTEDDKAMLHGICTNIVKELIFLNDMLQRSTNNIQDPYDIDSHFGMKDDRNNTNAEKIIEGDYAIGTEYKITQKMA